MWVIQSAWWIIYFIEADKKPRFLLIKRHAMSGKIEWVAPKGKLQKWETAQQASLREVAEETWISPALLTIEQKVWATSLRSSHEIRGGMDKDITYFLMHFKGNPQKDVHIQPVEWYLWIYKWATLEEVLGLIYYKNMREIFTQAHSAIQQQKVKKQFLDTI